MTVNRKVTGTAASMPAGLALGVCVSLTITIAGAIVAANLILREYLRDTAIGYSSMVILLAASAAGAAAAAKRIKHRRLYVCLLSGAIYYASLLAVTALFFGGQYQGMGVTGLVVLAGCGATGLLGMKGERKRGPQRQKVKHR